MPFSGTSYFFDSFLFRDAHSRSCFPTIVFCSECLIDMLTFPHRQLEKLIRCATDQITRYTTNMKTHVKTPIQFDSSQYAYQNSSAQLNTVHMQFHSYYLYYSIRINIWHNESWTNFPSVNITCIKAYTVQRKIFTLYKKRLVYANYISSIGTHCIQVRAS